MRLAWMLLRLSGMQSTSPLTAPAAIWAALLFLLPGCSEGPLDLDPDATPALDAVIGIDAMADAAVPGDADSDIDGATAPDAALELPGVGLCGFDETLPWESLGEILQLESPRNDTCIWLSRRNDCPPDGICKAVPFTLERVRVGHDGAVVEIDDPEALSWRSTHHNWCDVGEAWTNTMRYRIEVQVSERFRYAYQLTAFDIDTGAMQWSERLMPFDPSPRQIAIHPDHTDFNDTEVLTCSVTF